MTNDIDDSGGNAEYTWSDNQTSTLTQASGDFAVALIGGINYVLSYIVTVTTAPDGDLAMTLTTGIADEAEALSVEAGTHSYTITTKAVPGDFVIQIVSGTDTAGQFAIDDMSLKKVDALYENYWAYGDVDNLGYDTIYVRVTDDADPDTLDADAIQSSILDDPVEYTMTTFLSSGTWYFVVTAIDEDDLESDFSDELEHEITESATLTGTANNSTEADIVTGGGTIIITLSGDTWVATVGADNAITTALIAGIDSAQAEGTGWDAVVKANMVHGDVTRDSDTQVTILLGAEATYDITASEIITVTIPTTAVTSETEIVATPTVTIGYVVAGSESPTISYVSGAPTIGYAAGAPTIEAP